MRAIAPYIFFVFAMVLLIATYAYWDDSNDPLRKLVALTVAALAVMKGFLELFPRKETKSEMETRMRQEDEIAKTIDNEKKSDIKITFMNATFTKSLSHRLTGTDKICWELCVRVKLTFNDNRDVALSWLSHNKININKYIQSHDERHRSDPSSVITGPILDKWYKPNFIHWLDPDVGTPSMKDYEMVVRISDGKEIVVPLCQDDTTA